MNLIQILNGYAADLDVSGPQYATMAHYIRAGVDEIERMRTRMRTELCVCGELSTDPLDHEKGTEVLYSACRYRRFMLADRLCEATCG